MMEYQAAEADSSGTETNEMTACSESVPSDNSHTQNPGNVSSEPRQTIPHSQTATYVFSASIFIYFFSSFRMILAPIFLLKMIGGPYWLISPWTLWLMGASLFVSFCSVMPTIEGNSSSSKVWIKRLKCDIQCFIGNCRLDPQSEAPKLHLTSLSTFTIVSWCIFDILFSGICLVIVIIVSAVIFEDVGRHVDAGWNGYFAMGIAVGVFSVLGILADVALAFTTCVICGRGVPQPYELLNNSQTIQTELLDSNEVSSSSEQSLPTPQPMSLEGEAFSATIAKMACLPSLILCIVALGFTSGALHSFLKSTFYDNAKSAPFSNCDPMVTKRCSLPFPSSYWLQPDPSTETGYRVSVGATTLPFTKRGAHMSPDSLNQHDGFSVSGQLLWHLDDVSNDQLTSFQEIERSLLLNSTTLLMGAASDPPSPSDFYLHPHFAEVDYLSAHGRDRIAYVQPAKAMDYNTQYIVVVKNLTTSGGKRIPPSSIVTEYVSAYRAGDTTMSSDPRYERIVGALTWLDQAGVDLNTLQLLWDLHTASQSSLLSPITSLFDSTQARVQQAIDGDYGDGTLYSVVEATQQQCMPGDVASMATSTYFRVKVPWYLKSLERLHNNLDGSLQNLSRADASRIPLRFANILIQVPCSVALGNVAPTALLEFGHGLFESLSSAEVYFLREEANAMGWILWSMDWRMFSRMDLPQVARLIMHDADEVKYVAAGVIQGFVSKLAGRSLVRKILSDQWASHSFLPAQRNMRGRGAAPLNVSEAALPSRYMGDSMGSILGGGYVAYAQYPRAVMLVAGSPFSFLLGRSDLFGIFVKLMDLQFYTRVDSRIALTTWQLPFDAVETSGWAYSGRYESMDVLVQLGLGDSTVSTIGGRIYAANINATLLEPAVFPVALLPSAYGPIQSQSSQSHNQAPHTKKKSTSTGSNSTRSSLRILFQALYPGDAASLPTTSQIPPNPTNVHYCLPMNVEVMSMNSWFITYGLAKNPCGKRACVFDEHAQC